MEDLGWVGWIHLAHFHYFDNIRYSKTTLQTFMGSYIKHVITYTCDLSLCMPYLYNSSTFAFILQILTRIEKWKEGYVKIQNQLWKLNWDSWLGGWVHYLLVIPLCQWNAFSAFCLAVKRYQALYKIVNEISHNLKESITLAA